MKITKEKNITVFTLNTNQLTYEHKSMQVFTAYKGFVLVTI